MRAVDATRILTVSALLLRPAGVAGRARADGVMHGGLADGVGAAPRHQAGVHAAARVADLGRAAFRVSPALGLSHHYIQTVGCNSGDVLHAGLTGLCRGNKNMAMMFDRYHMGPFTYDFFDNFAFF